MQILESLDLLRVQSEHQGRKLLEQLLLKLMMEKLKVKQVDLQMHN
jgi:hypothetical protein